MNRHNEFRSAHHVPPLTIDPKVKPGSFYRAYLAKNNNPCVFDILVATFVLAEQISSRVGRPPHQNQPVGAQVKLFSSTKKTWSSVRGETRPNSTGENLSELKIDDHVLWHKNYVREDILDEEKNSLFLWKKIINWGALGFHKPRGGIVTIMNFSHKKICFVEDGFPKFCMLFYVLS